MQTKKHSILESVTNVAIGYFVAVGSQLLIFPLFDIHIPFSSNFLIGFYFTAISLVRSYILRRWFNNKVKKKRDYDTLRRTYPGLTKRELYISRWFYRVGRQSKEDDFKGQVHISGYALTEYERKIAQHFYE